MIGAGPGGYVAAIKAAQLGLRVAVVENREVGGTCLNRGCIPTKTLLHAAQLFAEAQAFDAIGLHVDGISYDISALHRRKDEVIEKLRAGIENLLKANKIELINGTATITAPHNISVKTADGAKELTADHILIATGSKPVRPPIEGLDLPNVVTSDELLSLSNQVYQRLVIIGGGVIGVEFASIFNALGCSVTVVEAMERVLPAMDREISQNLAMILKKRGVVIHTGAQVQQIVQADGELQCTFTDKNGEQTVAADGVLIAIGRKPNTDELFSNGFTVKMNRGSIVVDDRFCTDVEGVYAIGDVTSGIQLAHVASAQGICVAEQIAGCQPTVRLDVVPSCIYTNPEIAVVGISADDAKAQGRAVKTGKFILSANGKSLIENQDRGFVKLVFDAETDVILGAQLMCARATDLVSELSTAIVNKLTATQLAAVIRPHPTFTEAVTEAVEDTGDGAIHSMPRRR